MSYYPILEESPARLVATIQQFKLFVVTAQDATSAGARQEFLLARVNLATGYADDLLDSWRSS